MKSPKLPVTLDKLPTSAVGNAEKCLIRRVGSRVEHDVNVKDKGSAVVPQ